MFRSREYLGLEYLIRVPHCGASSPCTSHVGGSHEALCQINIPIPAELPCHLIYNARKVLIITTRSRTIQPRI
jgi:hypothetical protein